MAKQEGGVSYHISKSGAPAICRAKVRPCPRGTSMSHYASIETANKVADNLNKRLMEGVNLNDTVEVMNIDGEGYVTGAGAKALDTFHSVDLYIKRLESISAKAREKIYTRMSKDGVDKISTDFVAINRMAPGTSKSVDPEKMRQVGVFDEYSKDSDVKEHIRLEKDEDKGMYKTLNDTSDKVDVGMPFSIAKKGGAFVKDESGNYKLTEKSEESLRNFVKLENKIEQLKATRDLAKEQLMASMKENGITEIRTRHSKFVIEPPTTRRIADTKKMKDAGIYDDFVRHTRKKGSIRKRLNRNNPVK